MPQRTQALLLAAAFVVGGLVTGAFLLAQFQGAHRDQQTVLAAETAANLATALIQDTIARDALSLTVVLRQAKDRGVVASAAVYDDAGGLLVTVGAPSRGTPLHSRAIATRDTVVGRLQITISESDAPGFDWLFLPTSVLALIVLGAWQWTRLLPCHPRDSRQPSVTAVGGEDELPVLHKQVQMPVFEELEEDSTASSVLIVKVEPPRRVDEFTQALEALIDEYPAKLSRTQNEFCLQTASATIAVSAAITLEESCSPGVTLRMGAHCAYDADDSEELVKRARYIASLANDRLLVSKALVDEWPPEGFTVERFHSSFAQDDLYEVS